VILYATKFELTLQSRLPKSSTVIFYKLVLFEQTPTPYFTFSLGNVHENCIITTVWI